MSSDKLTVGEFRKHLKLHPDQDEMVFFIGGEQVSFFRIKERSGLSDPKPGEGICSVELTKRTID